MSSKEKQIRTKLYVNMAMMLISGTALSVIVQYQNKTKGYEGKEWRHPYFQSFVASFGHLGGFIVYWIEQKWNKRKQEVHQVSQESRKVPVAYNNMIMEDTIEIDSSKDQMSYQDGLLPMSFEKSPKQTSNNERPQKKGKISPALLLSIPSFLDLFEHVMRNVSNNLIAPSISQMLRSSVVVFAALLAVIFLKAKLYRHHYVSILAIIIGLVCVGISEALSGGDEGKQKTGSVVLLGISLQIIGQFFGASSYTVEEKLLGDNDDLDPTILIGWEGFWCTSIWLIVLPILQFIPCNNADVCARDSVENTKLVFLDYGANPWLIFQSFWLATLTLVINVNGVTITKYGSAAQRTVVDQARNVTVWVFFLIFTVNGQYLEVLTIYSTIQFVGFIILLMGVFIYNEIIIVRCCGFDTNTKVEQEKRMRQDFSIGKMSDITYKSQ